MMRLVEIFCPRICHTAIPHGGEYRGEPDNLHNQPRNERSVQIPLSLSRLDVHHDSHAAFLISIRAVHPIHHG